MAASDDLLPQQLFINITDKVSPIVLSKLLGMASVAQVYQYAQEGKLPDIKTTEVSYIDAIAYMRQSFIKANDAKLEKVRLAAEEKRRSKFNPDSGVEDNMHPLMAAKLSQSIKTEHAREAEVWQKIAIKNGEYVNFADKLNLVQPFMLQIRDLLLGIAIDFPEAEKAIDEGMENLFNLGTRLLAEVDIDRNEYVQAMLDKPVQEIIDED